MTGLSHKIKIIAEVGVNHNGSLDLAIRLVDAALNAGADIVKFQTWKTKDVITRNAGMANYQKETNEPLESLFDFLQRVELSHDNFRWLKNYCDTKGIEFLSTADEIGSARFLNEIQEQFKIGSAELTDLPFLREMAHFKKPIILSTGMGTMDEIAQAIQTLEDNGLMKVDITVLQCTSEYPAPFNEVNLAAIQSIRKEIGVAVGFSDHTVGIEAAIAAVAFGPEIIEKHLTLDKDMCGPDHKSSLVPEEFAAMVTAVRNVEVAIGDGVKAPTASEKVNIPYIRKSIVAKTDIKKGEVFTEVNMTVKRPSGGLDPKCWDELLGHYATRNYKEDDFVWLS